MKKYSLERYKGQSSRYYCPNCEKKNSFVLYVDIETGEFLNEKVGRCNHESSCGYHYKPKQYFQDSGNLDFYNKQIKNFKPPPAPPPPISYFDMEHLIETETNYNNNNFVQFLLTIYDRNAVFEAVKKYRIGTSDCWNGANVFWYLDRRNKVRSGKVMLYDKVTGKRVKTSGTPRINSMRSILLKKGLINEGFNQKTGLYGEHLLSDKDKPIALVESEKTAIIASIEFPEYIWLASGSRAFLTNDRIKVLKGRDVTLYPDNDAFDEWNKKASAHHFKISYLVKEKCSLPNADLADYILSQYGL